MLVANTASRQGLKKLSMQKKEKKKKEEKKHLIAKALYLSLEDLKHSKSEKERQVEKNEVLLPS